MTDEQRETILKEAKESVQAARDAQISEEVFMETLERNLKLLSGLHGPDCDCGLEERQAFAMEASRAEYAKEYIPTPKITDEPPLSFEEKKGFKQGTINKVKLLIKEGQSKEQVLEDVNEVLKTQMEYHKQKCASNPCALEEMQQLVRDTIDELYATKTTLTVEEILKLAEEKL